MSQAKSNTVDESASKSESSNLKKNESSNDSKTHHKITSDWILKNQGADKIE
jgi:hypothetical protein